jgi:hypothetical protein
MVPQSTPFGKHESHIEGNLHLRGRLVGLLTELVTVLPAPCRAGVTLNRHFPDTEVVGRDLPPLGVPRQRNSIAADSLTAKTARCSAPLGRNSLLCVHQGAPLPSSAVASDLISRSRWCGRRPQLGDQHQDLLEHLSRHRDLGHLNRHSPDSRGFAARIAPLIVLSNGSMHSARARRARDRRSRAPKRYLALIGHNSRDPSRRRLPHDRKRSVCTVAIGA